MSYLTYRPKDNILFSSGIKKAMENKRDYWDKVEKEKQELLDSYKSQSELRLLQQRKDIT